jgi:hypothetical protein
MATPDVEMHDSDSDSVLSGSLGSDTLEARSMVPDAYRNAPVAEAARTWVWTLHHFALDTLAIPATTTDCERTFSSGRKFVSPERNRLSDDIIEAVECLKAWWDSGIIKQPS